MISNSSRHSAILDLNLIIATKSVYRTNVISTNSKWFCNEEIFFRLCTIKETSQQVLLTISTSEDLKWESKYKKTTNNLFVMIVNQIVKDKKTAKSKIMCFN